METKACSEGPSRNVETLRDIFQSLLAALGEVCPTADQQAALLAGRSGEAGWPACDGWAAAMRTLPALIVDDCERTGLQHCLAAHELLPPTLSRLCVAISHASRTLGRDPSVRAAACHGAGAGDSSGGSCGCGQAVWRQRREKTEQVNALLAVARSNLDLGRVGRVVDVGCGKGHAIGALQASLGVPALGIDRDPELLASAAEMYPDVSFEACDVSAGELGAQLRDGDLVFGLHP